MYNISEEYTRVRIVFVSWKIVKQFNYADDIIYCNKSGNMYFVSIQGTS